MPEETLQKGMKSARATPVARSPAKEPAVQSHQTLINELNFATSKRLESKAFLARVEERTEEASVQTDSFAEEPTYPNISTSSWRGQQLSLVPNEECQVMIVTSREPAETERE